VISERRLVSSHSSFWRNAMPMADAFVRQMNRTLTRVVPPCHSAFKGIRNSLISELSFRFYSLVCNNQISFSELLSDSQMVADIEKEVCRYISRLERSEALLPSLDFDEIDEAILLAKNLKNLMTYSNPGKSVLTRPHFIGCGIVDDCEGDIIVGTTLYELKNVERDFRLADIRQLLTYCSLNHASDKKEIDTIGLINARSGLTYKINVNELSFLVAGVSANELFGDVIRYITVDTPSR
jgi:hypothetical protein